MVKSVSPHSTIVHAKCDSMTMKKELEFLLISSKKKEEEEDLKVWRASQGD